MGNFLANRFFPNRKPDTLDRKNAQGPPLFERALKMLGQLHPGEMYGFEPALQQLAKQSRDLNQPDVAARTALMYAALNGKMPFVRLLIARKADVNRKDKAGTAALHFAAQDYQPEAVEAPCDVGATIDAEDQFGNTPLNKAAFNSRGRGEVIRILLRHGADPDKKNRTGKSPRMLADIIAN